MAGISETPALNEVREDLANVKDDVQELVKILQILSQRVSKDIKDMKGVIDHTFELVVDTRYKVIRFVVQGPRSR